MNVTVASLKVPFFRVELDEEEIQSVVEVLRSGWLTTGSEARQFEQEFAAFVGGGGEAVAVNSNTAGMHLALEALGIGPGDEVIVPTLTFTATAEVVRYLGADPILVDVSADDLCIDVDAAARAITARTRAVMPVHFGGLPCRMDRIHALAASAGIAVIEDAAHAIPCRFAGVQVGAEGSAAAIFSFYANKTITTGEGGMLVSSDPKLIKRAKVMRLHGIDRDAFQRFTTMSSQWQYDVVAPGYKYNMTDVAAALGRQQLRRAERFYERRHAIARQYNTAFSDLPVLLPPADGPERLHSWHLYVLRLEDSAPLSREKFLEYLASHGVGFSVHYRPLHRLTYWRDRYKLSDSQFPMASRCADTCVSLPLFPAMSELEVDRVIQVVRAALS
jgi:dTDP-4-amino-4,6-dideoxygalactose transaminase